MKNPSAAEHTAATDHFMAVCGFIVFALGALWAVFFVPMNMDEAGIHHMLACMDYPFSHLHAFREACLYQDNLITPLGFEIARPEFYNGLWHSILYAPFYFVFHAPIGQYIFGLCFFMAFAFLIGRESKKPLLGFTLALAFFPFLFQFTHDTGPVSYALLLFPISAIFMRPILYAPAPIRYGYAVALPLLFIAATEEKPFFLYLLPSIVLFALALGADEENTATLSAALKKAKVPLCVAALIAAAGILFLLLSTNLRGQYYGSWLIALAGNKVSFTYWMRAFFDFLFYWPMFAHYTFNLTDDSVAAIIFKVVTLVFVAFCVVMAVRLRQPKLRATLLILSSQSSAIVFFIQGNTWAGHHFIFLWPPLIVLFIDFAVSVTPVLMMSVIAAFLALNLWSVAALTQEVPLEKNARSRTAIFHFFADDARASQAIINFSSWGGYYIQSLYGPKNQLVTYTEPYDSERANNVPVMPQVAQQLLSLSRQTGRTIYNVCYGPLCNSAALEAAFGGELSFTDALPGLPDWHVFAGTPKGKK